MWNSFLPSLAKQTGLRECNYLDKRCPKKVKGGPYMNFKFSNSHILKLKRNRQNYF